MAASAWELSTLAYVVAAIGAILFAATVANVLRTLVIPGGYVTRTSRLIDRVVIYVYHFFTKYSRQYARKNSILASQPAANLFLTLTSWMLTFLIATTLLLAPNGHSTYDNFREAGASLLTLGFVTTDSLWATTVDFLAGFTGLIIVALQIAYLPTLYSAYNRRETEVTLLNVRAGNPAWGPEVLRRSRIGAVMDELPIIYLAWERWAAELAESHVSYPTLLRFRSPGSGTSWITSLLAVMDAAAMHLALSPSEAPMQARLVVQAGYGALRQIGRALRVNFNEDPRPDSEISVSFDDFANAVELLRRADFPIERTTEEAYRHFVGWRVNYEEVVFKLAYAIDAIPAPWAGPRRWKAIEIDFPTVVNRTPERPEG